MCFRASTRIVDSRPSKESAWLIHASNVSERHVKKCKLTVGAEEVWEG